jgi:hypothetical protein
MTVGGSTRGSATTADTGPRQRERVRASHQASGVHSTSSSAMVVPARRSVRPMARRSVSLKGMAASGKAYSMIP